MPDEKDLQKDELEFTFKWRPKGIEGDCEDGVAPAIGQVGFSYGTGGYEVTFTSPRDDADDDQQQDPAPAP